MNDIQLAIQQLLDAAPPNASGGFVIFGGSRDLDFVQFSLEPNGLLLNWPTMQEDGAERLPMFQEQLEERGFQQISPDTNVSPMSLQLSDLQTGEFMVLDDGLYAQTGRDAAENGDLAIGLLQNIFGVAEISEVEITLEPKGLATSHEAGRRF